MSTQPKNVGVEAGDRALETALRIAEIYPNNAGLCQLGIAKLIQSAMNAQEREWREALREKIGRAIDNLKAPYEINEATGFALTKLYEIERLLAEHGEGR